MQIDELRRSHPRFVYKSFTITRSDEAVTIAQEFLLEPDIIFHPSVTIPYTGEVNEQDLATYAFHLGLIESISYWKVACSPEIVIEAGALSNDQIRFWKDLYLHGLGEFYFQNHIDFTQENFLTITATGQPKSHDLGRQNNPNTRSKNEDLILVGGGKDSAVTLALLKNSNLPFRTMVVNPTEASLANIHTAGLPRPLSITRVIDPKLLALNTQGYMNGHTPFSAYLAFLGVTVAHLYGNPRVVVSNERSADEGNVVYHGMEINHQYSKSFRFEKLFREYCMNYLTDQVSYFSFLRPLNDVQIAQIFAKYPEFFTTFRSCNVGSRTNSWCGMCAKCAFTYLILYPYVQHEQMVISFGADLFHTPKIIEFVRELVGLSPVKPFECVGTKAEAKLALLMVIAKYKKELREVPEGLLRIKSDLGLEDADLSSLYESVARHWSDTYNVPDDYSSILKNTWSAIELGAQA